MEISSLGKEKVSLEGSLKKERASNMKCKSTIHEFESQLRSGADELATLRKNLDKESVELKGNKNI